MRASRAGFTTAATGSRGRGKGTPALVGAMLASLLVFLGAAAGPATAQTETPTTEPQASEAPATTDTAAALGGETPADAGPASGDAGSIRRERRHGQGDQLGELGSQLERSRPTGPER